MKKPVIFTLIAVAFVVTLTSFMSLSTIVKGIFSDKKDAAAAPANAEAASKTLYDFTVKSIDGKPVSLSGFKGKKVVILNVASQCGYTPQYGEWERFYKEYGDKIVVLGFPTNNFAQEQGSNTEIAAFCKKNYGVTFPMFEKIEVVGKTQAPLYKWLTDKSLNGWNSKAPTWNFCKYVVDEQGKLTNFFASGVTPDDATFKKAVGI